MTSNDHTADVFGFIESRHPFYPLVAQLRALIGTAPEFAPFRDPARRGECDVHADLKATRDADGRWEAQRLYWCLQHASAADDGSRHTTSHMAFWKRDGELGILRYPDDPNLPALPGCVASHTAAGAHMEMLRYVPLRRVTFRARDDAGTERIGKLRRRRFARPSYESLHAVHAAVQRHGASFHVAAALGVDEAAGVFYQQPLAGRGLTSGMDATNAPERLQRVGRVHRELHAQAVPGLRAWSVDDYLATIRDDVQWIALFDDHAAARLRPVLATLEAATPASPAHEQVFCHGDFIASQLLLDGERVAVMDFDGARSGDRHQEMGKLLASLKYDLPHLRALFVDGGTLDSAPARAAEAAYLAGYAGLDAGAVDLRRLAWFRTCAEIHYLAMTMKKDAWHRGAFAETLDQVAARAATLDAH